MKRCRVTFREISLDETLSPNIVINDDIISYLETYGASGIPIDSENEFIMLLLADDIVF